MAAGSDQARGCAILLSLPLIFGAVYFGWDWLHWRNVATLVRNINSRPTQAYAGPPYIRRKTLIVVKKEFGYGTNPPGSERLGEYLAKDAADEVRVVVLLTCGYFTIGKYSNGGEARQHACHCEILDIADSRTVIRVASKGIEGRSPPAVIQTPAETKGISSPAGGVGPEAYADVAEYLSTLERK